MKKTLIRWIAHLTVMPLAVLTLQGVALNAQAFPDTNAEMKEAAADRATQALVAKVAVPTRTAWVPTSPKRLDSFKPVLPPTPEQARPQTLAKADAK